MRNIYKKAILNYVITVSLLISVLSFTEQASADPGDTTISVNPSDMVVNAGETFTVDIFCTPSQPIKAFEFKISFNPSLLSANSVSIGDIFNGYTTFNNTGIIDNNAGTIVDVYCLILGSGNVTDSGILATISFTAKESSGTSTIDLYDVGVTNETEYVLINVNDGNVEVQGNNNLPVLSDESPIHQALDIHINLSTLSINISDSDGDSLDWSISTSPDVGSSSAADDSNGTKTCPILGLDYNTLYSWYVNVTDGISWTNETYEFTTELDPNINFAPIISSPSPSNGSSGVSISISSLNIQISDLEGDSFNWSIETSADIGNSSNNNDINGTKTCSISGLSYSTIYTWYVNTTDGNNWTNNIYSFTIEDEPSQDDPPSPPPSNPPPDDDEEEESENHPPNTPTINISTKSVQKDEKYILNFTSYDIDDDQIRYIVDWGDRNLSNWTEYYSSNITVNLDYIWKNSGNYSISVMAQDINGSNSSWSELFNITVYEEDNSEINDTVIPKINSYSISNDTFTFSASDSYDPNNIITSYHWDFGDETSATGHVISHKYENPGNYTITLTLTDINGKEYVVTNIVEIVESKTTDEPGKDESKKDNTFIIVISMIISFIIVALCILFYKTHIRFKILK